MKNTQDIEIMIATIKNNINNYTKELSKAISKGSTYQQKNCMNEIGKLQKQEELLKWVLN